MARTKIGSLFADVTLNTKGLDKGIRTAQRKLRLFGRDATQTGKQLMLGIGTPMAFIGGQAINVFQNFEQEMQKVKAISGATSKEFDMLSKNARDLGATTRFTATNVAELQLNFSKLGFTATEIEKVTKATLNLALATGEELGESARVSAQTLRGFGLEANEMVRVVDVMSSSFSSSALDLNKFDTAMAIVSATATSAGVSLEQTTAMLAVLVNRGVDASSAGTALRNVFLEIAKQGLTLDQALDRIENSTNKNATAMQLFGKRGATVAQIIALNRKEQFKLRATFEMSAGTAQKMADIMDDSLQGSLFKLKSAFEGVQIELATKLAPILRAVVDRLSEFLSKNKEAMADFLISAMKVGALAMGFGALFFVVGQVAFVMANIVGVIGFVIKSILLLISPLAIATLGMKAFGLSFAIAGFAMFAKSIAIIVVVLGALKTVLEEVKGADISWGEVLIETMSVLATTLHLVVGALGQAIDKVGRFFASVVRFFKYMDRQSKKRQFNVNPMGFGGYGQYNPSLNLADPLPDEVTPDGTFTDPNSVKGIYESHKETISKVAEDVKKAVSGDFSGLLGDFKFDLEGVKDLFKDLEVPPELEGQIGDIEKRTAQLLAELKASTEIDAITKLFDSFKIGLTDAMNTVREDVVFTAEEVQNIVAMASDGMTNSLQEFINTGKANFKSFVNDILLEMQRLVLKKTVVNPLLDFATNAVMGLIGGGAKPSSVNLNKMSSFQTGSMVTKYGDTLGNLIPNAFSDFTARANGGSVTRGSSYLVGERGAELFTPNTSGFITPNNKLGGQTIVNFNVQATDAESFDNQIGMRRDMIVGMIDEAFHRRGQVGING
tara:strand:- start:6784 stop:9300 length:2517 start_codon:yes stop_codon:yes gene_type:complete